MNGGNIEVHDHVPLGGIHVLRLAALGCADKNRHYRPIYFRTALLYLAVTRTLP
jgi:hypothetical protein